LQLKGKKLIWLAVWSAFRNKTVGMSEDPVLQREIQTELITLQNLKEGSTPLQAEIGLSGEILKLPVLKRTDFQEN